MWFFSSILLEHFLIYRKVGNILQSTHCVDSTPKFKSNCFVSIHPSIHPWVHQSFMLLKCWPQYTSPKCFSMHIVNQFSLVFFSFWGKSYMSTSLMCTVLSFDPNFFQDREHDHYSRKFPLACSQPIPTYPLEPNTLLNFFRIKYFCLF